MRNNKKLKAIVLVLLQIVLGASKADADSFSLGLIGITSHGAGSVENDKAFRHLKRKITDVGYTVWNYEASATLELSGYLVNATVVNDCMNNTAYYLGAGYR